MLDFEKYRDLPIWSSSNKWTINHIHEIKTTKDMLPHDDMFYDKRLIEQAEIGKFYVSDESSLYFDILDTVPDAVAALVKYSYSLIT